MTLYEAEGLARKLTDAIDALIQFKVDKAQNRVAYFAHDLDEKKAIRDAIMRLIGHEPVLPLDPAED